MGREANEDKGKVAGSRRARSKKESDWWVRVTERGERPASSRRRETGVEEKQPVIARHAERWTVYKG